MPIITLLVLFLKNKDEWHTKKRIFCQAKELTKIESEKGLVYWKMEYHPPRSKEGYLQKLKGTNTKVAKLCYRKTFTLELRDENKISSKVKEKKQRPKSNTPYRCSFWNGSAYVRWRMVLLTHKNEKERYSKNWKPICRIKIHQQSTQSLPFNLLTNFCEKKSSVWSHS